MQPFSKVTENQRWNRVEADLRPVAPTIIREKPNSTTATRLH